jgi:mono/diheme cytochrome c family protein
MDQPTERRPSGTWRAVGLGALGLLAACADKSGEPRELAGADPDNGLALIRQSGCAACHTIPGVRWPEGRTAASLAGFGARPMIAGRLPNQPEVLVRWLRNPPSLAPDTAMPPSALTPAQARDVAAYLYTLDD